MQQIGEKLKQEESTWIKETAITEDGALVATTIEEGYKFQIYYNNNYGVTYVEYLGEEKRGATPNLTVNYDNTSTATANANIQSGSIKQIELSYQGKIENKTGNTASFNINKNETGWYTIRAISDKGMLKYAWIRIVNISDKLEIPKIEVKINGEESKPDGENRWYKTEPKVTLSVNGTNKIYYTLTGSTIKGETEYTGGEITLNQGITRINAYTKEGNTQSKEAAEIVKYDSIKPEIEKITVATLSGKELNGIVGENSTYYGEVTKVVEAGITAKEDTGSKINGYKYEVLNAENNEIIKKQTYVEDINTKLTIKTDGKYKIRITLLDQAGNASDVKTIEISKKEETTSGGEDDNPGGSINVP